MKFSGIFIPYFGGVYMERRASPLRRASPTERAEFHFTSLLHGNFLALLARLDLAHMR